MNGPYKVVYFAGAEITISISDENMYKIKLDIISTYALGGHTRIVTNNMLLFMFWYYQFIKRTSSLKAFFVAGWASYYGGDRIVDGYVEFQRFSCEFGQLY